MLFAASPGDTTIQVTAITTVGLIVVAVIGTFTAKITSASRKEAADNAEDASKSAAIAKDYAAALGAKDTLIVSLEARLKYLEEQNERLILRIREVERMAEEHYEQQRAAALLERDYSREISDLRAELNEIKRERDS